ncbi:MAG: hypothetical protein ABEJ56_05695 [Candidatus Nanohaloarchaea archaeon]
MESDEIDLGNLDDILLEASFQRGTGSACQDRVFRQFGAFVQDMSRYLVWPDRHEGPPFEDVKNQIIVDNWRPTDFKTYVELFTKYEFDIKAEDLENKTTEGDKE